MTAITVKSDDKYVGTKLVNGLWSDSKQFWTMATDGVSVITYIEALQALRAASSGQYEYGRVHPDAYFSGLRVVGYDLVSQESPQCYIWRVNYAVPIGEPLPENRDPANYAPNIAFTFIFRQEPVEHESVSFGNTTDSLGNTVPGYYPMTDSAGMPFDPPPTRERVSLVMTYLRYLDSYSPAFAMGFVGKINNDSFTIAGVGPITPRQIRCLNFAPPSGYNPTVTLPITSPSGTFTAGETVTISGIARGVVLSATSTTITLMNPIGTYAVSNVILGASSGATGTNAAAYVTPRIPVVFQFEIRQEGFYTNFKDQGYYGWYQRTTGGFGMGRIAHRNADGSAGLPTSSPVLLQAGTPTDPDNYVPVDHRGVTMADFSRWGLHSQIPTGVPSIVAPLPNGLSCSFIRWRNYDEVAMAGMGA